MKKRVLRVIKSLYRKFLFNFKVVDGEIVRRKGNVGDWEDYINNMIKDKHERKGN